MSSSYCTLHLVLHMMLIDIRDAWARPRTMCAHFFLSGIPSMYRLHVCVDLSFDPSGRLMEICLLDGCTFFTGITGRKKCLVAPVSAMASCLGIYIIDVEYAVSICLLV